VDITSSTQFSDELRQQARRLTAYCSQFREASNRSAIFQLATTAVPFFVTIGLMFWVAHYSVWATLLLSIPAGALLIRFFALQHDCGHGSLFPSRPVNEAVGRVISVLTFTPYDHWRRSHALHHQLSGNLDKRGYGDIETMTVNEYKAKTFWGRLRYRAYRHPLVVLVIGPPLFFLVLQRLAMGSNMPMRDSLLGILGHDLVLLPIYLVATWIGGWLFFVQHQFEEAHWDGADEWDMKIAALKGSSYLVMPKIMNWFTCNIGIHHIHHLCAKIPNYRLRECLNGNVELQNVSPRLTLLQGLMAARLSLWDETSRRLISFRELASMRKMQAA
jgi:omega-6 fatty acid desaturase (delta-12 desaturase)